MARSIWRAASTFPLKTASYRLRAAGGTGVGRDSCADLGLGVTVALVVALALTLRVLTLVRDVAVLRIEERSEAEAEVDAADVDASEFRDDGGRGRGGGGGGGPSRFGTSKGECRGEGGTEGDFDGRWGNLGGSRLVAYTSQSCDAEETEGLTAEVTERFSNDSSRLIASGSRMLPRSASLLCSWSSCSTGNVATWFESEPGVVGSVPPSEESDTEWNEEMEEAGACREGMAIPSFDSGG